MATNPAGAKVLPANLDPRTLTLNDANAAVAARLPGDYAERQQFAEGEHWQNAAAWMGPMPKAGADGYTIARDEIERGFTPQDVLAEVAGRHVGGVVGHEPQWAYAPRRALKPGEKPTDREQRAIDEAAALMTPWWDRRKVPALLQRVVWCLLWATRAPIRLYVPKGLLVTTRASDGAEVTGVQARTIEEALAQIWPDDPLPEQATVLEDPDTKRALGLFVVADAPERQQQGAAFLTYLNGDQTVLRTVTRNTPEGTPALASSRTRGAAPLPPGAIAYDFGKRLTMAEGCRRPFITPALLQQQKALNLALSMLPRNLVTANFLERIFIGVQPPGEVRAVLDAQGNKIDEVFVPAPYTGGAGSTAFLQPTPVESGDGGQAFAPASVEMREPTSPKPSIEAVEALYASMLASAHQRHILISGDGQASGVSRRQARADYAASLELTATVVAELVQWLLETALAMAETFAGTPGKYTSLVRAVVTPVLDLGPIAAEDQRAIAESVEKGLLSQQTAMQRMGVIDVDAELARIAAQPGAQLEVLTRQLAVVKAATEAGLGLEAAAQLAGLTPAQLAIIRKDLTDEEGGTTDERGNRADPTGATADEGAPQSAFAIGDRVKARVAHMPGMIGRVGTVRIVRPGVPGATYGILFDGDTEVHKWYVEEEIAPATERTSAGAASGMAGMKH